MISGKNARRNDKQALGHVVSGETRRGADEAVMAVER